MPKAPRDIRAGLNRLARCWDALAGSQAAAYAVHDELPDSLLTALQHLATTVERPSAGT